MGTIAFCVSFSPKQADHESFDKHSVGWLEQLATCNLFNKTMLSRLNALNFTILNYKTILNGWKVNGLVFLFFAILFSSFRSSSTPVRMIILNSCLNMPATTTPTQALPTQTTISMLTPTSLKILSIGMWRVVRFDIKEAFVWLVIRLCQYFDFVYFHEIN